MACHGEALTVRTSGCWEERPGVCPEPWEAPEPSGPLFCAGGQVPPVPQGPEMPLSRAHVPRSTGRIRRWPEWAEGLSWPRCCFPGSSPTGSGGPCSWLWDARVEGVCFEKARRDGQ